MARFGFIHSKLDIKLLVLYIMARVAAPIDFSTLTDLVMCDDGVDYFQYAESVGELIGSGHLSQQGDLYSITDKGRRNGADTETSLSPVIRKRCDQRLAPLNQALKRKAQIRGNVTTDENTGDVMVHLAMDDDRGSLFSMSMLVGTEEEGNRIADYFSRHPDRIYNGILGVLFADEDSN